MGLVLSPAVAFGYWWSGSCSTNIDIWWGEGSGRRAGCFGMCRKKHTEKVYPVFWTLTLELINFSYSYTVFELFKNT